MHAPYCGLCSSLVGWRTPLLNGLKFLSWLTMAGQKMKDMFERFIILLVTLSKYLARVLFVSSLASFSQIRSSR